MAYDQIHVVDATSQMIEVALRSSTTGQLLTGKAYGDMTIKWIREGAASAATVSVVTMTKGTWTSGGFVETDIGGIYQHGIQNAALGTGAKAVTLIFSCTGAIDVVKRIVLLGADLRNAANLGLSGLATANPGAAGGLAIVGSVMGKSPATLAAADVSGNLPTDLQTIKTQTVTASAEVTFPASIGTGTSTYAGADTPGTTELLTRIPDATPGEAGGLPTVDANNHIAGIQGTKNQLDDLTDAPSGPSAATIAGAVLDEAKGTHTGHVASIPTSGTGDWTAGERDQIRYRLGIDGDTDEPVATPVFEISGGTVNSVSEAVTLADDGITAAKLADSAIAEIAAAATGGATMQQMRDSMLLAPSAGTPAAGSIDDHLDDLAAALAAATSTLTVVSAVDGDVITIYQAVSFQATISGLAIPAAWTKLWWTVKQDPAQADTDAIIQMVESNPGAGTDGLLRINGAAGTAANGTLTVSQATGTVVIDLVDENTDDLALATGLIWSLKALASSGATILLAVGTLNVRGQATQAVA